MMGSLEGATAVVTGGAGGVAGLGSGLVRRLAAKGMQVAVLDHDLDAARLLADSLRDAGGAAIAHPVDVTEPHTLHEAAAFVESSFSSCNILCAHVGGGGQGPFQETSLESWQQAMRLMVLGTVATVQAFLPLMQRTSGFRSIVLTSSVAALVPGRYQGPYRAAKAAVTSIGETLALELAPLGIGTTIAFPSGMLTPDILAFAREASLTSADGDDVTLTIAQEMAPDPTDLATGEEAARIVVEAVLAGSRYVITHGKTAAVGYQQRHELLEQGFAELAERSYLPG
jgi:3-oxoacyl-[acyl-carrier protein] reductase